MLREEMTEAERRLWSKLRNARIQGVSFRRQHAAGPYVLDFYSPAIKLAIELDGGQHNEDQQAKRDEKRDAWFASRGVETLRFWNFQVMQGIDDTMDTKWFAVERLLRMRATPTLALPLSGGGEDVERSS